MSKAFIVLTVFVLAVAIGVGGAIFDSYLDKNHNLTPKRQSFIVSFLMFLACAIVVAVAYVVTGLLN
ncbi:MAG: hypothetical protein DRN26_02885 [Thermoplasmata archaeon]|nr:MAG: hypothetical protein DRN26_02885 [Thermoplasmata archaeon]